MLPMLRKQAWFTSNSIRYGPGAPASTPYAGDGGAFLGVYTTVTCNICNFVGNG